MTAPSRHFSMIRSLHLADLFTLGNAACGVTSIFAVQDFMLHGGAWKLLLAFVLLPVAVVLDFLDGRIARMRNSQGVMGRELDSLSDVISFGVAPAVLAHALGFNGAIDVALLLFFVACGVARLARYNVTAEALSAGAAKVPYFEGTPITTSLVIVGVLGLAHAGVLGALPAIAVHVGPLLWHPITALFAVSGCLMVSRTLRVPKP